VTGQRRCCSLWIAPSLGVSSFRLLGFSCLASGWLGACANGCGLRYSVVRVVQLIRILLHAPELDS
jgi:hypothetical protein